MNTATKVSSLSAALLAAAVTQVASATLSYTLYPTPVAAATNGYATLSLTAISANGILAGTENTSSSTVATWVASPTLGMTVVGLGLTPSGVPDTTSTYYYYSSATFNYVQNQLKSVNTLGDLLGSTGRYVTGTTSSLGRDTWIYLPSSSNPTSNGTSTTVLTPTIIGPTTTLADANGLTSNYSYPYNAAGAIYHSVNPVAMNNSGQVLGYSSRYTGIAYGTTYYNRQLGQDAWIDTAGTDTLLGLGVSNSSSGYSYTDSFTGLTSRSTTPIAINDNGWVTGYNNRYTTTGGDLGYDGWVYNGSATYQVGLTGGIYENAAGYRKTFVTAINALNQVAGYNLVYNQGANTATYGTNAWIYYAPAAGTLGGAGTAFTAGNGSTPAAGSYVQVGLTDSASAGSATTMGHISSTGFGSTTIISLNNAGQATGTSLRYLTTATGSQGTDVWFYDGKGTTRSITPIITSGNTNASGVTISGASMSNYVGNLGTSSPFYASSGITTLTSTGLVAGYTSRYASSTTSTGEGQDGWVYDPSAGANGTVFVIPSPTVAASSDGGSAADYGSLTIKALSPNGVAVGYYYAASGSSITSLFAWDEASNKVVTLTTSAATLDHLFAGDSGWDDLLTTTVLADANGNFYGTGNTATVSTTANGAYEILPTYLLGDANLDGKVDLSDLNIVLNHLGATDSFRADGNFDGAPTIDLTDLNDVLNNLGTSSSPNVGAVTAVPEPASLTLLAVGGAMLMRRRR